MSNIYEICHDSSSLSDVQISILNNSVDLLQFASDLSQREVSVFVPGKAKGTMVIVEHHTPLFQGMSGANVVTPGQIVNVYDEPVAAYVMQQGSMLMGAKEMEYGKTVPMAAYPFVDNAGGTIAVITFVGQVEPNRELLTETAFMALQVPIANNSKQLYKALSVQDGIILISGDGKIIYANELADSIMHLRGREAHLAGENIYNSRVNLSGAKRALASHEGFVEDIVHGQVIFTQRVIPLLKGGKVSRLIIIITERTEIHRKEQELMVKTSVIKEIHHRVKNNLQTIASLLRMQKRRVQSEEAKHALDESLNRILSISVVHEILSHHDEDTIDITDVAQKLLQLLLHGMVSRDSHIEPHFDGQRLILPSEAAASLALVINELITNAIVHGFEGMQDGILSVSITNQDGQGQLIIRDTGKGIDPGSVDMKKHLGLQIVTTLVEKDLQGKLEFSDVKPSGTEVKIQFPLVEKGA